MLTKIPQITICSSCNGWGFQNNPDTKCQECRGKGVFKRKDNTELFIDAPHFINIKGRKQLKTYRVMIKAILLSIFILLGAMITIAIIQLFS